MVYGRIIVDGVFRAGHHHSNHKKATAEMVKHIVNLIRKRYRADVPIIIRQDSGYFDQKLYGLYEELDIGYLSGGKLYKEIKEYVAQWPADQWATHRNDHQEWSYVEFGDRRKNWKRFRRVIYCRPAYEDQQRLLEFARPDTLIYTNLGTGGAVDLMLTEAGSADLLSPSSLIGCYHGRGRDELGHCTLKDFIDEQLPFKRFQQKHAFYYTALIAFALFESFKSDITGPVVAITAYPTTLRRSLIDVAGKIVTHGGRVVLKVSGSVMTRLRLEELWQRCRSPPPIPRFA